MGKKASQNKFHPRLLYWKTRMTEYTKQWWFNKIKIEAAAFWRFYHSVIIYFSNRHKNCGNWMKVETLKRSRNLGSWAILAPLSICRHGANSWRGSKVGNDGVEHEANWPRREKYLGQICYKYCKQCLLLPTVKRFEDIRITRTQFEVIEIFPQIETRRQ